MFSQYLDNFKHMRYNTCIAMNTETLTPALQDDPNAAPAATLVEGDIVVQEHEIVPPQVAPPQSLAYLRRLDEERQQHPEDGDSAQTAQAEVVSPSAPVPGIGNEPPEWDNPTKVDSSKIFDEVYHVYRPDLDDRQAPAARSTEEPVLPAWGSGTIPKLPAAPKIRH